MIELEIQGLSERRGGLLVEVGRFVLASGFTLVRQRLVEDDHGILLTMVVQGPLRQRRALETVLDAYERFISVKIFPFVEGGPRPHFAASRKPVGVVVAPPAVAVPPPVAPAPVAAPALPVAKDRVRVVEAVAVSAAVDGPELPPAAPAEPEFEFILPAPRVAAPARAASMATAPFVERVPLGPDEAAVENALRGLEFDYPRVVPQLQALQRAVAEGARESSLALAGRRMGAWVFEREHALDGGLALREAIGRIGAPALRALVEVDQQGSQLHIHDSPLCAEGGGSGCSFFSGFLEGLLGPVVAPGGLSIFPVCCRSYGADGCVLAISE
ncbi:hypothetical protein IMW82_07600 [Rhodanobacter sp. B2A1Ga4]|uniref:hypothetical protein n=1 Tax=Rhodanobacter TaxID=75309 RepID=UPI000D3A0830|nr:MULTISPECIES: hypothetical protein [Rhodanobacter]MBQ4854534.1 hypothetical protein [Rhodanobacter sp. B2A1Ga4]